MTFHLTLAPEIEPPLKYEAFTEATAKAPWGKRKARQVVCWSLLFFFLLLFRLEEKDGNMIGRIDRSDGLKTPVEQ